MTYAATPPHVCARPNRPDPPEKIRPRCDVEVWDDSDTVTIHHLTRAEAERLYRLAQTDIHLFPLCYVLNQMFRIDLEEVA